MSHLHLHLDLHLDQRIDDHWAFKSPRPHYFEGVNQALSSTMIVLKISNSSEVVAAKVGKFLEFLTPDSIDHTTVEDQVIKKLVENLAAEGIKGEIAAVKGIDLDGQEISLRDGMKVRKHESF